jgi:hypothetical protein
MGTYQDVLILLVSPLVSLSAADESKFESESKESIPKKKIKKINKTRNSNIKLSKSSSKTKEVFTVNCNGRRRRKKKELNIAQLYLRTQLQGNQKHEKKRK